MSLNGMSNHEVVCAKTHQSIIEDKEADISAMMHFIPSHDRTGMIPYPHPCQLDVCDLAVFIRSL